MKRHYSMCARLIAVVSFACVLPPAVHAAEFHVVDLRRVYGMSADGSTIVGEGQDYKAAYWTRAEGPVSLQWFGSLNAANDDGSILGGSIQLPGEQPDNIPIIWRPNASAGNQFLRLETPEGAFNASPQDMSADGSRLVGLAASFGEPFGKTGVIVWSKDGTIETLPPPVDATRMFQPTISDDGNRIVSSVVTDIPGGSPPWLFEAAWHDNSGEWNKIDEGAFTQATNVSGDGRSLISIQGRWTSATGVMALEPPVGGTTFAPLSASFDGAVVVGYDSTGDDSSRRPVIWDELHGARWLDEVLLQDYGLSNLMGLPGCTASEISADGTVISGSYSGDQPGEAQGWAVYLDKPILAAGDTNGDGQVDLGDFGTLKANFGIGNSRAQGDLNFDRHVDLADFGILKSSFGQGVANAAVPEPAAVTLALVAAILFVAASARRPRMPLSARTLGSAT